MTTLDRYRARLARGDSLERATFFSDAVFAIAMTLLVIELRLPELPEAPLDTGPFDTELFNAALGALLPGYLTFLLSFAVVGMIWLSHHRKFTAIVRYDQGLLRLNLVMLLFVASLPLPTAILGEHGDQVGAVVVYALTIASTGFALTALWLYAWHRGLIADDVDEAVFRLVLVQSFPIPGFFLLSVPVALLAGPTAAQFSWLLAIPASLLIPRVYRARAEVRTA